MSNEVNGISGIVEEAKSNLESISAEELADNKKDERIIVDVRDIREIWINGSIPDAKHAPRGMIEFWADPKTTYHKDFFDPERKYLLYCNKDGRAALAAKQLQKMGYENVAHLEGGFSAWEKFGGDISHVPQKDYSDK